MDMTPAVEAIKRAEAELRAQAQQALAEGRYADVASIARLADGLVQLTMPENLSNGAVASPATETGVTPSSASSSIVPSQVVVRATKSAKSFPRFEREGDRLVKIAWSKRDRAEYEHKAPFRVVSVLVDAIRSRKGVGAKFTAPDVLPLRDAKSRMDVPSYQSYLALAWLRYEGVVVKHGRNRYSLKPTAATQEQIAKLWATLPMRD